MSVLRFLLPVVLLSGCAPLMGRGGRGGGAGLADKPVASKETPTTLFAADGTRCLVTEEKFRNTALGDRVWCFWTADGSRSVARERMPAQPASERLPRGSEPSPRTTAAPRRRGASAPSSSH